MSDLLSSICITSLASRNPEEERLLCVAELDFILKTSAGVQVDGVENCLRRNKAPGQFLRSSHPVRNVYLDLCDVG
jgi:hypothetical protein